MSENTEKQQWGSAFGFIISSIGYAVGVGAIWKFSYQMGMNGGGIFLLMCIVFMIIIAIPLAWGELTLGRYTQTSAIAGMRQLEGKGSFWVLIGWFGAATVIIMISYYITIVSDVMFYIFKYLSGGLSTMSVDELGDYYNGLQVNMGFKWITVLILYALTFFVISRGVQGGLERAN
ncbi:MAG: sodium-dependent transporter, partial [Firmicutes bacterium]|nr:sodium-dependent transporter [Bacillota bacterium]